MALGLNAIVNKETRNDFIMTSYDVTAILVRVCVGDGRIFAKNAVLELYLSQYTIID